MSTREQLIKARLGILALADELKDIARACRLAGVSGSHFYEIKQAYETFGKEGLAPKVRRKPRMPNQTPPELERQILGMTEQYPTYSYLRLADQLKLVGVGVSAAAVRYVWQRHGLATRFARLLWLERRTMSAVSTASSRGTCPRCRWVERGCPSTRQARRSGTLSFRPTCATRRRCRAGLRSLPQRPPSESTCRGSSPPRLA